MNQDEIKKFLTLLNATKGEKLAGALITIEKALDLYNNEDEEK